MTNAGGCCIMLSILKGNNMDIAGAMLKIAAAMALGFFLYKIHILNDDANAVMSKMITIGAAPCMIFSSVMSLSSGNKTTILTLLAAGVGLYAVLTIIATIAARIIVKEKKDRGVFEAMMTFGNSAFLAFPVGQALMGDLGVSYLAILNIHQNVFAYTLGVLQLTKGNKGSASFSFKKLISPPNVAAVLGIVLLLAGVSIPDIVMQPIGFIGQICSPLSMMIIGATIASFPLKNLFTNWRYYAAAAVKLLIVPAAGFALAFLIWGPSDITSAIAVHCSMPTAAIISMIAIMYEADYHTTTSATGLMDILCIGTIPLVWALTRLFY